MAQRHSGVRFGAVVVLIGLALIVSPSNLAANDSAQRAAQYLVGAQLPSGYFAFEHDFRLGGPRPNTELGEGRLDYIARETGTAYILSNYFLFDRDPKIGRALFAALRKFNELSLPIAKARGQQTLEATGLLKLPFGRYKLDHILSWSGLLYRRTGDGRLVAYDRSYETAWGAATAFALLTELHFYRATHDPQFAAARHGWLKGLLVLYDGHVGFRALPDSIDENAMSNGEIWLAFAYYTDLFPRDRETAAFVAHLDDDMLRSFGAAFDEHTYTWAMKAAAQRLETTSDVKFRQFVAKQTQAYLDRLAPDSTHNTCAAVEGMATAFRVLSTYAISDQRLVSRLRQRIDREMIKNLSLQIQPGQTRIELGNSTYLSSPAVTKYAGAFLAGTRQPYTRIDYSAHCISALLMLREHRP